MKPKVSSFIASLALFVGSIGLPNVAVSEQNSFSRANTLLFFTDHLANVSVPNNLRYTFTNRGAAAEAFSDIIEVRVTANSIEGQKKVTLNYFTGERHRYVPPITNAKGNPVLTLFLQREVHEMGRLTQGPWRHFQNRIKLALEQSASISPVTFQLNGRATPGQRIRIEPYRDDPKRSRFEKFAAKYYEITLSEDLPGMIYEIRGVVPGNGQTKVQEGAEPLIDAVLRYHPGSE